MHSTSPNPMSRRPRTYRLALSLVLSAILSWATVAAAAVPVFGGSGSLPLLCDGEGEPSDASPAALDLVGSTAFPPVSVNHDEHFLYFRYRVDGDPAGPGGFNQSAWVALVQVPDGNPFQYQYVVSLNGNGGSDDFGNSGDTVELWANTEAMDIDFSPVFHDTAEVRLFAQKFDYVSLATVNETPLARSGATGDGSAFGGNTDYFVDFAIPLNTLLEQGVISSPEQVDDLLFFPATSTNPSNYNKDMLDGCTFLPATSLAIVKTASPEAIPANAAAAVSYDIVVTNTGQRGGRGVVVEDADAGSILSDLQVVAGAGATVQSTDPVRVTLDNLAIGESLTVTVSGTVTAACDASLVNVATAFATNAQETSADATLIVGGDDGFEICDSFDNDCDGSVDEGADGSCNDGNICSMDACVAGTCVNTDIEGCVACATDGDCNDGNSCTTDSCSEGTCAAEAIPGCVPCTTDGDCNDENACTADTCTEGTCSNLQIDFCTPCDTDDDCGDGNSCTVDACEEGVCGHQGIDGCIPCATGNDCNDGNTCTDDVCNAQSVCEFSPVEGCIPCETDGDCADDDACTSDRCSTEGSCVVTTIPGCVPCDVDDDCVDDEVCTTDLCLAGACVNRTDPDCSECTPTAEVCGDGIDNDCDEATDCDDENCSEAPVCDGPVEICGDCLDNDNDGFVDLDDPDCGCVEPELLNLRQLRIKTKQKVRKKRLKVRGVWDEALSVGLDPRETGLTLQLSDDSGTLFCSHFAADGWSRKGKRRTKFRNRDKTTVPSNGMRLARFKVNKKGRVIFTARGPRPDLRMPSEGEVKVSVQVGELCRVSTAEMRTKRRKLVFP
jgi:hypothetical protein